MKARNAYTIIIGKTEGKRQIEREGGRIILKRITKVIDYECVNCRGSSSRLL
jgi:hypothetical protein